jgi:hypothetical protein
MFKITLVIVGFLMGLFVSTLDMTEHTDIDSNSHKEHSHHMHSHEGFSVADDVETPSVSIQSLVDTMSGVNLRVETENYTFTPESVGGEPQQNAGHAHVYVNDVKIARLYSNWIYISGDNLEPGENTVRVTLNADSHSEWQVDGQTVAAEIIVVK